MVAQYLVHLTPNRGVYEGCGFQPWTGHSVLLLSKRFYSQSESFRLVRQFFSGYLHWTLDRVVRKGSGL